ncbi:Mor transcription activator family protein [Acidovorax sp. Leaf160]|uniref:Mor transcription activator family protein n=1 Tax=Acidovorax sp. Leaf160 TaxID=1736280 RepID=UPI0009EBD37D|nr:Mor transcription activator family protein [Acidovorax sp. Leaf160]
MTPIHFDDLQGTPQSPAQAEDAAIQLEREFLAIVRQEIGMHDRLASVFAQALVSGLRSRMGGQELYIPAPDRSERDAAIRREFNGCNMDEVMRKHGLSRTRIYEICGAISRQGVKNPPFPLETGQRSA